MRNVLRTEWLRLIALSNKFYAEKHQASGLCVSVLYSQAFFAVLRCENSLFTKPKGYRKGKNRSNVCFL